MDVKKLLVKIKDLYEQGQITQEGYNELVLKLKS